MRITPTSETLEADGVWVPYYTADLKIARYHGDNFNKVFANLTRPHRKEIEAGTFPEEKQADLMGQALAESILLGWKNVTENGSLVEYSVERAKQLMIKDRDCRAFVLEYSRKIENYIPAEEEAGEIAGKS